MKMLIKLKNADYPEGGKEQIQLNLQHYSPQNNFILINLDNRTVLHVLKFS